MAGIRLLVGCCNVDCTNTIFTNDVPAIEHDAGRRHAKRSEVLVHTNMEVVTLPKSGDPARDGKISVHFQDGFPETRLFGRRTIVVDDDALARVERDIILGERDRCRQYGCQNEQYENLHGWCGSVSTRILVRNIDLVNQKIPSWGFFDLSYFSNFYLKVWLSVTIFLEVV